MRHRSIRRVYRKSAKKKNELYLSPEGAEVEIPCMSDKALIVDWDWTETIGSISRKDKTFVLYKNEKIPINEKKKVDLDGKSLVQDFQFFVGDSLYDSSRSRSLVTTYDIQATQVTTYDIQATQRTWARLFLCSLVTTYDIQATQRTWARLFLCRKWHPWNTGICNYTVILKRLDKSRNNKTFLSKSSFDVEPLQKLKLFFEKYPGSLKSIGSLMLLFTKSHYSF